MTDKDKNRHKRIKSALRAQNKTFAGIAERIGKTRAYIRNVSIGEYFVPGIARILAYESRIPVEDLWPDEFLAG